MPYDRNTDQLIEKRFIKAQQIAYYMKNNYSIIYIDETSF
jgi:hypothetical protein